PYKLVLSQEAETGQHVISAQVDEQPPIWWGAMAGDAVHNLRAALDLVVVQLVMAYGGQVTKVTGFPIADSFEEYQTLSRERLAGASAVVKAEIDALRPYR